MGCNGRAETSIQMEVRRGTFSEQDARRSRREVARKEREEEREQKNMHRKE